MHGIFSMPFLDIFIVVPTALFVLYWFVKDSYRNSK